VHDRQNFTGDEIIADSSTQAGYVLVQSSHDLFDSGRSGRYKTDDLPGKMYFRLVVLI
jgi:dTDP-4-dehydrorhamnose reductase